MPELVPLRSLVRLNGRRLRAPHRAAVLLVWLPFACWMRLGSGLRTGLVGIAASFLAALAFEACTDCGAAEFGLEDSESRGTAADPELTPPEHKSPEQTPPEVPRKAATHQQSAPASAARRRVPWTAFLAALAILSLEAASSWHALLVGMGVVRRRRRTLPNA